MIWYWAIFVAFVIGVAVLKAFGLLDLPALSYPSGWAVMALVLVSGGWMGFDGGRALIVGDYVTPKKGRHAGQLGTWSRLARGIGIDPRSNLMKSILLTYGVVYVLVMLLYVSGIAYSNWLLAIIATLGFWYWPFATLINITVLVLVVSSFA